MGEDEKESSNNKQIGKVAWIFALTLSLPVYAYRYSLSYFLGRHCRFQPTCSQFALDALSRFGPWVGLWLALARISRCRPGAAFGFDPIPDQINPEIPWYKPWRYGRWR